MESITKLIVLLSTAAALFVSGAINARGWAAAFPLTLGAFALACTLSAWNAGLAAALVLLFTFTFPVFVAIAPGPFVDAYTGIWMAALFGVMLPNSLAARGWSFPDRWKIPLALWALTVALVWPFVALRQIDFVRVVMDLEKVGISIRGIVPQVGVLWVAGVALTLVLGILWFEWLFLFARESPHGFRCRIVPALIASWIVATAVALYQFFVDVTFLNSGQFGFLRRASGTMRDANVFGVAAALCGPAFVLLCRSLPTGIRYPAMGAGLLLSWLGAWASGSRTALAAAMVALAFLVIGVRHSSSRRPRSWRIALAAVTLAFGIFIVIARWGPSSIVGPLERLRGELPKASLVAVTGFAYELLWRRAAYGTVAVAMIRDHPLVGVGVGSFHLLTADYGAMTGYLGILVPDNAQNWFRHQLAEFGLLGSIGWIVWVATFGVFLLKKPAGDVDRFAVAALRGALIGLAAISLLGMPSQHIAVTLLFWTLAFWYVSVAGSPHERDRRTGRLPENLRWGLVIALAVAASLGTWYLARHDLRIANMAKKVGYDYRYGFYGDERTPEGGVFRWSMHQAVAVIQAPKPWLKLTVLVNHPDLAARPVRARVWRDGELVLDQELARVEPVTKYVRVPGADARTVLDFWCSRVFRPADFGANDPRELGLQVGWEFVDAPPPNATVAAQ